MSFNMLKIWGGRCGTATKTDRNPVVCDHRERILEPIRAVRRLPGESFRRHEEERRPLNERLGQKELKAALDKAFEAEQTLPPEFTRLLDKMAAVERNREREEQPCRRATG
ncbi:hypothetical protein [Aliiroseovarius sp. YM-037]|uniref:hypothetical protein n=1 Tax=Aliiroseovarius sp. YM-037 TaxID=3341728 RepID=UPI003A80A297